MQLAAHILIMQKLILSYSLNFQCKKVLLLLKIIHLHTPCRLALIRLQAVGSTFECSGYECTAEKYKHLPSGILPREGCFALPAAVFKKAVQCGTSEELFVSQI